MPPSKPENDAMTIAMQAQLMQISNKLGGLTEAVENLRAQWRDQDKNAMAKIDAVRDDVVDLGHRVGLVEQGVKIIQPSITVFNEERLRDEGAKSLGKLIWGGILIAAGGLGWAVHEIVTFLFHK